VTAYVRGRVAPDSVEDVVAETFVVCWRKLDQVPREPLPWLYAVARKTLANEYRKTARQAADPNDRASELFPEIEGDQVLARAFALLGEHDREVLRLIAWESSSGRPRSLRNHDLILKERLSDRRSRHRPPCSGQPLPGSCRDRRFRRSPAPPA